MPLKSWWAFGASPSSGPFGISLSLSKRSDRLLTIQATLGHNWGLRGTFFGGLREGSSGSTELRKSSPSAMVPWSALIWKFGRNSTIGLSNMFQVSRIQRLARRLFQVGRSRWASEAIFSFSLVVLFEDLFWVGSVAYRGCTKSTNTRGLAAARRASFRSARFSVDDARHCTRSGLNPSKSGSGQDPDCQKQ